MAAIEAVAAAFLRLETLGRAVDLVAGEVNEGLPITQPRFNSVVD